MRQPFRAAIVLLLAFVVSVPLAVAAGAADVFTSGMDSNSPGGNYLAPLYFLPQCNSLSYPYDDYFGEIGYGDSGSSVYEAPGSPDNNSTDISDSYHNYVEGHGPGAAAYFFLVGPDYEPSGTSDYQWGEDLGWAAGIYLYEADVATNNEYTFEFLFADVEVTTGEYGWDPTTSRNVQVWDGFYTYLQSTDHINVGVYSAPDAWNNIMGGVTVGQVEWTYEVNADPNPPTPCPSATFSGGPGGINATFFHSSSVKNNIVWQWSINSGYGDFDQINLSRYNRLLGTSYVP